MSLHLYRQIIHALGIEEAGTPLGIGRATEGLPSWFDVSGVAEASIAAAAVQIAAIAGAGPQEISVDRRLCGFWFGWSLRPQGWTIPNPWDSIAGDYKACDGWIRLHTNAPHHRDAALRVLGTPDEREAVAAEVAQWEADKLEMDVVEAGGCAAVMRSMEEWANHPQGHAIATEPLIHWSEVPILRDARVDRTTARPLDGVRVLDLTRVLAGPVATRVLALFGANVLRIDPPDWDEPGVIPEVTLGKRCAGLDLHDADDRSRFGDLLRTADILVHGYRPGALEKLGFGKDERSRLNPGLIDVSLNAYGWTGPWAGRRGFDSLVQMSAGIAEAGMRKEGVERPFPLPVQALDQATGYLMAAAAARALIIRRTRGIPLSTRVSLARTAWLLSSTLSSAKPAAPPPETSEDLSPQIELTDWGPARRIKFPVSISGVVLGYPAPACMLRSSSPSWGAAG